VNNTAGAVGTNPALEAVNTIRRSLWDSGFYPVPVVTMGKRPLMGNWPEDAKAGAPAVATPAALNTGILAEGLRAIDIDVDDSALVATIGDAAKRTLGSTPFIRSRCDSPRKLLLYRAAEGAPRKRQHPGKDGAKVEVLGQGQQFLAFGRHPEGAELEWARGPGTDGRLEDVPTVTEGQITEFLAAIAPIIGTADTKAGGLTSNVIALPGTKAPAFLAAGLPDLNVAAAYQGASWFEQLSPSRMNDLLMAAARSPAFAALADADYATWRDYLFAFHAAGRFGATSAAEAARAWSRSATARYPGDAEFDRVWRSLKPGRIGVGTLLHKLQEVGFDLSPWRADAERQVQVAPMLLNGFSRPISLLPTDWDMPDWIVPGLLLRGAVTVIAAAGAGSKTTLSVGLCAAMAGGRLGFGPLAIAQPPGGLRTLYVAGEESFGRISMLATSAAKAEALQRAEYRALATGFRVHDALESGFRLGAPLPDSRARSAREDTDGWLAVLRADMEAQRPDLVVIDTGPALLAVPDENDNLAVTALLRPIVRLANAYRCAVLVLLHTPKLNRDDAAARRGDASLVRGGGAWTTTPRAAWTITTVPDSEAVQFIGQVSHIDSVRRLEPAKLNDGKMPAPMFFTTVSVDLKDGHGNPVLGRAIRWLVPPAAATSNTALDSHKRAALAVAIAGAKDTQGATVPWPAAKTGASAGYKLIAAALQQHDPALSSRQADSLAKQLIDGFLASGVLTAEPMAIPKYKPDGKPNGTVTRTVLKAHPEKAPWWMAANPMHASTAPEQAAEVAIAQATPSVAEPESLRHAAVPATTTVVE
jgi:hypothetical protein